MRSWIAFLFAFVITFPTSASGLEGCVYTADGSLVPNAKITASILEQQPFATVTATNGCFALTTLPDALIALRVESGTLPAKTVLALPDDPPLAITLSTPAFENAQPEIKPASSITPQRDGGTITGLVHVGAKPLAGAPVIVQMFAETESTPFRVITDAKGRFQINGLARQRYSIWLGTDYPPTLRSADFMENHEPPIADLTRERAATIDLALIRPPLVTGRVVDPDGKPVRGAEVQVILNGRSRIEFTGMPTTRTTADGRYTLAAPPFGRDQAVVLVRVPRHSSVRSKPFTIPDSNLTIDVTLPKFQLVTVRIIDSEKKPLAGARLAFIETEEVIGNGDPAFLLANPYAAEAARSNADGEVELQLAPNTYDFVAGADSHQRRTIGSRAIAKSGTFDIALAPSFAIRGRVHRNGTGVANVLVSVMGDPVARDATMTDAQGRFEIDGLARESYRLNISKYDELVQQTIEAKAPSSIEVPLDPAGTLLIRVLDADTHEPVPAFIYSIRPAEALSGRGNPLERGIPAGDGTFKATLPLGTYRITITARGYTNSSPAEVRLTERESATLEVALERGITVTGRVIDEQSAPVESANVWAMESNTQRRMNAPASAQSAADGTFSLSGMSGEAISLNVRKEGFVPFQKTLTVDASLAPVEVRLTRGLSLEGTVTRGGKPVADAQVAATTSAIGGEHQPATTDTNGRFVLRGLIAARYIVSAYKDELRAEVRNVDPAKQKEVALALDDPQRGIVYGTVTGVPGPGSGKITRRMIFVSSEENGTEGMIDDAGNYRIEDAPVGMVYVTAQIESAAGGLSSTRKQAVVTPGQATRVDLDVTGSVRVSGRVLLDGRPLPGARVSFATTDGMMASAIARDDGAYEISLAGPGRFRIFAFAERATTRQFSTLRDIRGGETIDLDLREQIIEGSIVDAATRQPIEDAFITLTALDLETASIAGEVRTDARGRFRLDTSNAGPHRITASARGYAQRTITLNLGGPSALTPFTFELSPVSELRVRVIDAKTNAPLEAHVYLTDADGNYIPVRAERSFDGSAFIFFAAPGKYRLMATVYGYTPQAVEVTAPGTVDVKLE